MSNNEQAELNDQPMKVVVIEHKNWGTRRLRNPVDGSRCCLGFACEAYGVSPEDTKRAFYPSGLLEESCKLLPSWLFPENNPDLDEADYRKASYINDDEKLSMSEKERLLKPIFAKHGIDLQFVD